MVGRAGASESGAEKSEAVETWMRCLGIVLASTQEKSGRVSRMGTPEAG